MPGKSGILPVHSSFSVPVLIPLKCISTITSPEPMAFKAVFRIERLPGASSMIAELFKPFPLSFSTPEVETLSECQTTETCLNVKLIGHLFCHLLATMALAMIGRSVLMGLELENPAFSSISLFSESERGLPDPIAFK